MTAIPTKPSSSDLARWRRQYDAAHREADRLRSENCQLPVTRLVRPLTDEGEAEVLDTIIAVVAAPPGWKVAFACKDRSTGRYLCVEYEDVLAFAIGLEHQWPITACMSAEHIATSEEYLWRWAVVAPDGTIDFWNGPDRESFRTPGHWLDYLNRLEAKGAAA